MSNKLIILVLLVGIIYNVAAIIPACGPNQQYNSCGTACPKTCRNPSPEICTLQCVSECQCVDGYYRNDNNDCVLLRDC
ncbi:hypothetical protein M0802_009351 [Mischocyttarus mexicanus]|nr:hypothetical protein M0802_009351 [Mischocyttarus mexicanus]